MKRIAKKLCSAVCALLAFSGNRGGALTKEILCNAGQWLACYGGGNAAFNCFYRKKEGKWILEEKLTCGQKFFGCAIGIATIANAVDAAKRSYDIAHDVVKGSNNKPDTTNKKESKNYWPILEAIFGVSQLAWAFGHRSILNCEYEGVCRPMAIYSICGLASMTDAYLRFRGSHQIKGGSNSKERKGNLANQTLSNPKNSKDSSSDKK